MSPRRVGRSTARWPNAGCLSEIRGLACSISPLTSGGSRGAVADEPGHGQPNPRGPAFGATLRSIRPARCRSNLDRHRRAAERDHHNYQARAILLRPRDLGAPWISSCPKGRLSLAVRSTTLVRLPGLTAATSALGSLTSLRAAPSRLRRPRLTGRSSSPRRAAHTRQLVLQRPC